MITLIESLSAGVANASLISLCGDMWLVIIGKDPAIQPGLDGSSHQ